MIQQPSTLMELIESYERSALDRFTAACECDTTNQSSFLAQAKAKAVFYTIRNMANQARRMHVEVDLMADDPSILQCSSLDDDFDNPEIGGIQS